MKIIVGCPTRNRMWIMEEWRNHVEQAVPGNWDLNYVFVTGEDDKITNDALAEWKRTTVIQVKEPEIEDVRSWGDGSRYEHMVYLRNKLLDVVRYKNPDLFLSLDSDILISQDAIRDMSETIKDFDAVGGLTWFDPIDPACTNVAKWRDKKTFDGFKRIVNPGVHEVDIIMGIKLMTPEAYHVDYSFHRLGEDLGWNRDMFLSGKRIGVDGRNPSKHVMGMEWKARVDKRVGY